MNHGAASLEGFGAEERARLVRWEEKDPLMRPRDGVALGAFELLSDRLPLAERDPHRERRLAQEPARHPEGLLFTPALPPALHELCWDAEGVLGPEVGVLSRVAEDRLSEPPRRADDVVLGHVHVPLLAQAQRRAQDAVRILSLGEPQGPRDGVDGLIDRGVIGDPVKEEDLNET